MSLGEYLGAGSAITGGLYHLEDVNDSSGNSRTLTNNNSVTFTAGVLKNGANFGSANTNKYLRVANNMGITGGACTIVFWVNLLAEIGAGTFTLVDQRSTTNNIANTTQYDYNGGTRRLAFYRVRINTAADGAFYTVTLGTTLKYCVIYTYDATNVRGYVNGSLVTTPTASSGNGAGGGSDSFSIGAHAAGQYASALIDEAFIENKAWSAKDVQKYYTFAKGRFATI